LYFAFPIATDVWIRYWQFVRSNASVSACDNRRMADGPTGSLTSGDDGTHSAAPARPKSPLTAAPSVDKMICERCGAAEMYRMHAVWRCPACGFKTDCCGW